MKPFYTGKELIAYAVAVDEFQGNQYIKSSDVFGTSKTSNFKLMLSMLNSTDESNISLNKSHFEKAEEICSYFEGLVFKAIQRSLSDFEIKITDLIKADNITINGKDTRLPIVASLPSVYRNNIKHDSWSDEERDLRKVSDYEGELGKRSEFVGEIRLARYMNRTNSMLVAVVTEKKNIVKFFYDLNRSDIYNRDFFKEGKQIIFSGLVKKQDVSEFSRCKETLVNRVTFKK